MKTLFPGVWTMARMRSEAIWWYWVTSHAWPDISRVMLLISSSSPLQWGEVRVSKHQEGSLLLSLPPTELQLRYKDMHVHPGKADFYISPNYASSPFLPFQTWLLTTQDIATAPFPQQTSLLWPPQPTFYSRLRTKFLPTSKDPLWTYCLPCSKRTICWA